MNSPAAATPEPDDLVDDWRELGACKGLDPGIWYPGTGESHDVAVEICNSCPVTQTCLEVALVTRERYGIWGGASERERRRILRRRNGAWGVDRPAGAKGPRRAADPDPGPGRRAHRSVASKSAGPPNRTDSRGPSSTRAMTDAQAMTDSPTAPRRRARKAS